MLKLANCRDEDWFTFTDSLSLQENGCQSIAFYQTIINHFILGKNVPSDSYKATILYQLSNEFQNDSAYPFNSFNILEHRAVWIEHLKNFINLETTEQFAQSREKLPKQFYHLLYQYYMIVENAHWISEKAKVEVQKIHDLEMSPIYFYTLRDLINNLKK